MFGQLSEVCLVKPPWPLQLLPPGDGLRENGVHYAFASKVHAWGWDLSFTNPVSPWERISWARQGWDQVHLGYRRRLRKAFRPETDRYVRIEDHIRQLVKNAQVSVNKERKELLGCSFARFSVFRNSCFLHVHIVFILGKQTKNIVASSIKTTLRFRV